MTTAPLVRAGGAIQPLNGAHIQPHKSILLKIDVTLCLPGERESFLDSGATANFINFATVKRLKIPTVPLKSPLQMKTIDG